MSQLRQREADLAAAGIRVKIIGFDAGYLAQAYVRQTKLPWPLLVDSERTLYAAYGMLRGSFWRLHGPVAIVKYLWLTLQGYLPGKPGADWSQLGGDVLIDPQGIVRMHHVSLDSHDRPRVQAILDRVRLTPSAPLPG